MWEKLGGLAAIVIAVAVLYFISVFRPPVFVQIIVAIAGSIICLIGIVFLFAEGRIFTKDRRGKKAPKVG
jgi:archaellum biogenesis protein FlaJ (TadC family)